MIGRMPPFPEGTVPNDSPAFEAFQFALKAFAIGAMIPARNRILSSDDAAGRKVKRAQFADRLAADKPEPDRGLPA